MLAKKKWINNKNFSNFNNNLILKKKTNNKTIKTMQMMHKMIKILNKMIKMMKIKRMQKTPMIFITIKTTTIVYNYFYFK